MEIHDTEVRVKGNLIRIGFLDGEGYQFLDDPEETLATLRKRRPRIDLFTFIQKLSDTTPRYNYPLEWENLAALQITTFDDWIKNQINFKVRNKVRKAAKNGVVVREVPFDDVLIRGISKIYNESPLRQGRRFPHYGKDLEALRKMKATFLDRSTFIGAFFEDNLIGFVKLVSNEDGTQAGLMHILSMICHRDKAPTNALIAQAVRSCADRGVRFLWYANLSYGRKQQDGLADFKLQNGFNRIDVPRYYVPLTVVGRITLRLSLHHGILERIPEPIASTYRRVRGLWYSMRFSGLERV